MDSENQEINQSSDSHYEPLLDDFYDCNYYNSFYHKEGINSMPLEEIDNKKEEEMINAAELAQKIDKEMDKENSDLKKVIAHNNLKRAKKLQKKNQAPAILGEEFKPKKARAFQFTFNDIERWPQAEEYLKGLKGCNYFIACKEKAPTTGHIHIHCYAQFKSPTIPSMEKLGYPHCEKCYGSPEQNILYIKKEKPFDESLRGEIIAEEGTPNLKRPMPTIKQAKEMTQDELDELPLMCLNLVQKVNLEKRNEMNINDLQKKVQVFYLWGPSGCGKTSFAKIAIKKLNKPFNQVKFENGFWSGISQDCEIALYDDWRDSHMKPSEFINFVDYNIHNMNIKGGCIQNKYKYIFITSIQDPQKIYWESSKNNEEQVKQWIRRMKIINIEEEYGIEEIKQKYNEIFGIREEPDFDINNLI